HKIWAFAFFFCSYVGKLFPTLLPSQKLSAAYFSMIGSRKTMRFITDLREQINVLVAQVAKINRNTRANDVITLALRSFDDADHRNLHAHMMQHIFDGIYLRQTTVNQNQIRFAPFTMLQTAHERLAHRSHVV